MTESQNAHPQPTSNAKKGGDNPFEQICLYFGHPFHALSAGQLVRQCGFSAHVYQSPLRILEFLGQRPLIAGAILQGASPEEIESVKSVYKGPVFTVDGEKDEIFEGIKAAMSQILKNEMRIEDVSVQTLLQRINQFLGGTDSPLFVTGPTASLDLLSEYVNLFAPGKSIDITDPLNPVRRPKDQDQFYVTRDLTQMTLEQQTKWIERFDQSKVSHLILETGSLEAIDERYESGAIDTTLYERIFIRNVDATNLANYSFEEVCVQPPHKEEPKIIFDELEGSGEALPREHKSFEKSPTPKPEAPESSDEKPGGSGLRGLLSRLRR